MIDFATLKGHEKTIALYLLWVSKRVPKPSIAKSLDLDRQHCSSLIDNLITRGIVNVTEEFGILYCSIAVPSLPKAEPSHLTTVPSLPKVESSPLPPSFSSNGSEFKFNIHESQFESESNSIEKKISKKVSQASAGAETAEDVEAGPTPHNAVKDTGNCGKHSTALQPFICITSIKKSSLGKTQATIPIRSHASVLLPSSIIRKTGNRKSPTCFHADAILQGLFIICKITFP